MLASGLKIAPGLTTVIGSGGKTTLLRTLGRELQRKGHRVILCTTTKIYPFSHIPNVTEPSVALVEQALAVHGLICVGRELPALGKLGPPALPLEQLMELADFVLAEGDGSAGHPLKAHLDHEPVIPACSYQTICVVGLSGLGKPVSQAVHRPERFCALSGLSPEGAVTPEAAAKVLNGENLADRYLLNQLDGADPAAARQLQGLLNRDALLAALDPKQKKLGEDLCL